VERPLTRGSRAASAPAPVQRRSGEVDPVEALVAALLLLEGEGGNLKRDGNVYWRHTWPGHTPCIMACKTSFKSAPVGPV
jgi:hypothetical protein